MDETFTKILPLISFVFGAFWSYTFFIYKNWKKRYITQKYLYECVTLFQLNVATKLKELVKYRDEISEIPYIRVVNKYFGIHSRNIDIISSKDIYEVFLRNKNIPNSEKGLMISSFFQTLGNVKHVDEELNLETLKYKEEERNFMQLYFSSINEIRIFLAKRKQDFKEINEEDFLNLEKKIKDLDKVFGKKNLDNGNCDEESIINGFSALEHSKKWLYPFSKVIEEYDIPYISNYIRNCKIYIEIIKRIRKDLTKNVESMIEKLTKASEDLVQAQNKLYIASDE
jgi:hypothetical protein